MTNTKLLLLTEVLLYGFQLFNTDKSMSSCLGEEASGHFEAHDAQTTKR